jgi:hypothetical protein
VADPALFQELLNRNSLGGAAGLGGEMSLGPGLMRKPPMNVGIGYDNIYGTDINASFDPTTRTINARAAFPLGKAQGGLSLEASGSYNTDTRQPEAYIGVRKRNAPPEVIEAEFNDPNRDKYAYGLSLNKQPKNRPMTSMPPMGRPSMDMPAPQPSPVYVDYRLLSPNYVPDYTSYR